MSRGRLTVFNKCCSFDLTAEQEDRFRRASLASDLAQARICVVIVIAALALFLFNDYWLFGLAWPFFILAALRLALVLYTAWLLRLMTRSPDYQAYDRATLVWGLVVVSCVAAINVSRPDAYTGHMIVSVVMIFLSLLAIPNRFPTQVVLSLALSLSEVLVVVSHLHAPSPAALATLTSLFVANACGIVVSRLLHASRRSEFLAHEQEREARAKVDRELVERRRAEDALQQLNAELERRVEDRTAALVEVNQALTAEITVRRRAEEDLRESERRFRQLAENIDDVFWLLESGTGRFLYVSPVWQTLWGRGADEADDFWDLFLAGVDVQDREQLLSAWRAPTGRFDQEFRIVRPDGEVRWVRGRTFPIPDSQGGVERVAGIIEDITVQKGVQKALIQAERATTASRLALSLAHEINNPLQAAIGCLDLACEALARGEDAERYLHQVSDALERAARVVAQLRALDRDAQAEEWQLVDLHHVLHDVLLLTRRQCEDRHVRVVQAPGPQVLAVRLMPNAMQHVCVNLMLNALDAMPDGGELLISAEWGFKPDGIWIRFADTGTGLDPEIGRHLFEPFHTTKAEGLGLSLFICQRIIQQHGGWIECGPHPGGGTVFSVFIPANV